MVYFFLTILRKKYELSIATQKVSVHIQKKKKLKRRCLSKKNERTAHFKKEQNHLKTEMVETVFVYQKYSLRASWQCAALLSFPTVTILSVTICSVRFSLFSLPLYCLLFNQ